MVSSVSNRQKNTETAEYGEKLRKRRSKSRCGKVLKKLFHFSIKSGIIKVTPKKGNLICFGKGRTELPTP